MFYVFYNKISNKSLNNYCTKLKHFSAKPRDTITNILNF